MHAELTIKPLAERLKGHLMHIHVTPPRIKRPQERGERNANLQHGIMCCTQLKTLSCLEIYRSHVESTA
jgi:hypothetical protein